ncbi:hypothetical protein [Brevifollis gellanilyticus]|uniref:Uncharacterized protein n=1 Tax=Brevifollis gellanilyticus TaxID=748831 RepID=A0A512M3T0_9BACT|nr:hypothetical protein [Brevifollis gellanilyticus]GEP41386.1 hypothetical protein BGE01nite_06770 [Brevifollis gellanilyticus]
MKRKQIDEFETLNGQLQSFYTEINTLVKKSPNDALNAFKLRLLNSALEKANRVLGTSRVPFADFEVFADEEMPTNSDVLLMVSQYLNALEQLRIENIYFDSFQWLWRCDDEADPLTFAPKKLRK